ncbi:MAG: MotA/TolQ/ExbB proton channel family protein [Planctomycetes bacterium]|nr:MotA/TolQ/ExbB proton channel family protein [Planctomycetota bacterium]
MNDALLGYLPESGWEWFSLLVNAFFVIVLVRALLVIRRRYRSASQEIRLLREVYDAILVKAEAGADRSDAALAAQERIELDDTKALLARRSGVARRLKLHDRYRRQREGLRLQVEEARSRTESLPLIGILGTVFGLMLASLGQESIGAITSGIWIALLSTFFALTFMLIAKYTWEADVLAALENLEDRERIVFDYAELREIEVPEPTRIVRKEHAS